MRKMLFFVVFIVLHLTAKGQDPTPDAWVEDNSNTAITLPPNLGIGSNLRGLISILKTPSDSTLEQILKIKVADAPKDFLAFTNSTILNGRFMPSILAHNETDRRFSMSFSVSTTPENDLGNEPIVKFDARTYTNGEGLLGPNFVINRPLFSWTNLNVIKMILSANGSLGIGTTAPQAQLHTTGSVRFEGIQGGVGNALLTTNSEGVLLKNFLPNNSTIAVTTTSPTVHSLPRFDQSNVLVNSQLFDNGSNIGIGGAPANNAKVTVYGTINAISDVRTKRNIAPISNALQMVNQLNGYYYNWTTSNEKQVGLIAQEVENVLPELVSHNESGTKFLNYDGLTPVLVEAIKEQQQLLQLQATQIKELQKEIEKLKKR
ncbi:tail fiber domain-containing protein [Runella limosa]|uniref:tail fiber domain-containing protein n=1 Tax=Runella limosa TaxID=370978 RepID=UPI000423AE1D|nr:tail fiber domain-containing protein [Runella limosa]